MPRASARRAPRASAPRVAESVMAETPVEPAASSEGSAEGAEDAPAAPQAPPGFGELLRTSLLICGGSVLVALLAFWVYRAYAWLFPG